MKILVDIVHMADVNFYKNAVKILRKQGHDISISVMDRGNLPKVVKKEYGKNMIVGKHSKGNILKKSFPSLLKKFSKIKKYQFMAKGGIFAIGYMLMIIVKG